MSLPFFDIELGRAEWSSFMPALMACLNATSGDVLEVGVGHYSTPALHEFCAKHHRALFSVEEDFDWGAPFRNQFNILTHPFALGSYDIILPQLAGSERWSVVLLDHSPGPRRAKDMLLLIDSADFIVVHDYHLAIREAFEPLVAGLNCHVVQSKPPTAIFSKCIPIPDGVLAL